MQEKAREELAGAAKLDFNVDTRQVGEQRLAPLQPPIEAA